MKTVTEFSGFTLAAALKKRDELAAGGKTVEELPAALGEVYKLEGDKLKYFTLALDLIKAKPDHLKRVVVLTLSEGEKAPAGGVEKDGAVYVSEYFFVPQAQKQGRGKPGDKGPRGKGRGKGRGGKGRDGRGRRTEGGGNGSGEKAASGKKPHRGDRPAKPHGKPHSKPAGEKSARSEQK